jgi:hypothetical protein
VYRGSNVLRLRYFTVNKYNADKVVVLISNVTHRHSDGQIVDVVTERSVPPFQLRTAPQQKQMLGA